MTDIPAPLFSHSLGDDAVLVPRTPEIADAYHGLVSRNQARLAKCEPWASQESTLDGTRDYLAHLGHGRIDAG